MLTINVNGSSYTNVSVDTLFGMFCGAELTPYKDSPPISVKIKDDLLIPEKVIPSTGYVKLELAHVDCFPYSESFVKNCGVFIYSVVTRFKYSVVCTCGPQTAKYTVCYGFDNEQWFGGLVTFLSAMEIHLPEIICFSNNNGKLALVAIPPASIHMNLEHEEGTYVSKDEIVVQRGNSSYLLKSKSKEGFTFEDLKMALIQRFGFLPDKLDALPSGVYQYVDAYAHIASPLRKKM